MPARLWDDRLFFQAHHGLEDVLNRPHLRDEYDLGLEDVETIAALILLRGEALVPTRRITVCSDTKDNTFLEVVVDSAADTIVSGDDDLLDSETLEGSPIIPQTISWPDWTEYPRFGVCCY